MKWIRTMPEGELADLVKLGKTFIWDATLPIIRHDRDYRPVLAQLAENTVIIEWDLAVSPEQIEAFTAFAEADPDRVAVAPYQLYRASTDLDLPVWAHRRDRPGRGLQWVWRGEPVCDLFGFGLVYLPAELVARYLAEVPGFASDTTFSRWHYRTIRRPVPIAWSVRPVHLHYRLDNVTDNQLGLNPW